MKLRQPEEPDFEATDLDLLPALTELTEEIARLRKTLLKQGHAQELFQGRVEEAVARLVRVAEEGEGASGRGAAPNAAQLRTLMELDRAVLHLLRFLAGEGGDPGEETSPRSVREGLGLLQIRVRNLQRSFGLEPIPSVGRPFDDRWHQAWGVCQRPDLDDGQVAEEVLPGYRLGDRIVRPALVIVNRRPAVSAPTEPTEE